MNEQEWRQLLQEKEEWEDMEGIDDGEWEQEWTKEGIRILEKLIRVDRSNKVEYLQTLSRLYLNFGRNEKVTFDHFGRATRYLKQAAYIDPSSPKPCYHLSFLMEKESNEEAALFYAERAIKLGLDEKQTYKLYCNMALCYHRLRLETEASHFVEKVLERAVDDPVLASFAKPYLAKVNVKRNKQEYIPMSKYQKTMIETDDEIDESVLNGDRAVLVVHPYRTVLNGERDAISMSPVKTQILETIMLTGEPISAGEIGDVLWGSDASEMSASYIPRMINDIRRDIKMATDIAGKDLLQTVEGKYIWNHVLLKGSVHYKQHRNRRFRPREGITIL